MSKCARCPMQPTNLVVCQVEEILRHVKVDTVATTAFAPEEAHTKARDKSRKVTHGDICE
jgi:UDP-2,3-diacylglucosamine pyrophosphatase LpxH